MHYIPVATHYGYAVDLLYEEVRGAFKTVESVSINLFSGSSRSSIPIFPEKVFHEKTGGLGQSTGQVIIGQLNSSTSSGLDEGLILDVGVDIGQEFLVRETITELHDITLDVGVANIRATRSERI